MILRDWLHIVGSLQKRKSGLCSRLQHLIAIFHRDINIFKSMWYFDRKCRSKVVEHALPDCATLLGLTNPGNSFGGETSPLSQCVASLASVAWPLLSPVKYWFIILNSLSIECMKQAEYFYPEDSEKHCWWHRLLEVQYQVSWQLVMEHKSPMKLLVRS